MRTPEHSTWICKASGLVIVSEVPRIFYQINWQVNLASLSWDVVQEQIPAVNFVRITSIHTFGLILTSIHRWTSTKTSLRSSKPASIVSVKGTPYISSPSETFKKELQATAIRCNYADYFEKHVTYPPTGLLPLPGKSIEFDPGCDVWDAIFNAALIINPAFNIYRIFDTFPILWDVLGFPGSFPQTQVSPLYFNRQDVKLAIHAPLDVDWTECSNINVFPQGDGSLPSALTVLPNVIEKSKRTVVVHGLAVSLSCYCQPLSVKLTGWTVLQDFILIAEGWV